MESSKKAAKFILIIMTLCIIPKITVGALVGMEIFKITKTK